MAELREQLQELFGLDDFRPAQREVIEDVMSGQDVLCVMPTGAGKSLCYQLPAAVKGGLTLVVSPLISLMQDQVQQLRDEGIAAACLNSTLSVSLQRQVLEELEQGFDGLLYVAPERFWAPSFQPMVARLRPKIFAIDEAHCISSWGHDFRTEYSRLAEVRRAMGDPPTIALTATATQDVREDIVRQLELREPRIYITGFDRPNLRYEARNISRAKDKAEELLALLEKEQGTGIVYCATRGNVDEVAAMLKAVLPKDRPVFAYHAGLEPEKRTSNQERFMQTPRSIAVATNAFGMGINKPDIRFVVHYNIPGTLEGYYQEAGRAGRDGLPSRCTILFSYQDRYVHEFFISKIGEEAENSDPERIAALQEHAREKLDTVIRYAQTHRCRRQMILDYFGDLTGVEDCDCDVCRRGRGEAGDGDVRGHALAPCSEETTTLIRKILSGVARISMRGQFGAGMVAEVLAGADNEKILRWRLHELSVHGLLKAHAAKRLVAMLHRLMEAGLARQRDPDGMKFRPVVELTPAGVAVMKGEQAPPASLSDLVGQPRAQRKARVTVSGGRGVAAAPDAEMDDEAQRRFERLRAARSELAKAKQLPAYCICHDSVLKAIALAAPRSLNGLEMVKGMGPNKVKLYGGAFLGAVEG